MFHNIQKLKCHENEKITLENEREPEKSAKKDIELCLEVEMDDEVRDIITSPDKCSSTLLDVTVIKPNDIDVDQMYTQKILNGEEVRKLITIMELEKQGKQRLIDQILAKDDAVSRQINNPKSAGDYVKTRYSERPEQKAVTSPRQQKSVTSHKYKQRQYIPSGNSTIYEHAQKRCSTDESSEVCSDNKQDAKSGNHEKVQQIYTTPRTYNDIKSIFTCKNKHRYDNNEKPNRPCLCQNCAIVGVLRDSQKRPFITENLYDPRDFSFSNKKESKDSKAKRKKSVNFREESHVECHYYFKHLSAKIKDLEDRLALQEERSVPRDYFKRIITKLVAHISKITNYGSQDKFSSSKYRDYKDMYKNKDSIYGSYGTKYHVHSTLVDQKPGKAPAEKEYSRYGANLPSTSHKSTTSQQIGGFNPTSHPTDGFSPTNHPTQSSEGLWKWGEEILKPGIDLKNKIMVLLEEAINNLKKPRDQSYKAGITKLSDELPKAPPKPVNEVPVRDTIKKDVFEYNKNRRLPRVSNTASIVSETKRKNNKFLPKLFSKGDFFEEPVNISYLNPKLSKWQEESVVSFKFESIDLESLKKAEEKKLNENYKMKFLDTLSNTREVDKITLWDSIWNQAKINGQTKQDKVTIQIPDRKNLSSQKTIEIEYTIAELEKLLTGEISVH